MKVYWIAFRLLISMILLTGVIYPLIITFTARLVPGRAHGSFVEVDGHKIGSLLIGQKFESDRYFWPRPSAVDFNPLPSGGSNFGWTSAPLKKAVRDRREKYEKGQSGTPTRIPSDLLYASGSGLDPHISVEAAYFQAYRVAKARRLPESRVIGWIDECIQGRQLGFLGNRVINVLLLNTTLDEKSKK
jgi:K+-transporting ATPase ATPase C chain